MLRTFMFLDPTDGMLALAPGANDPNASPFTALVPILVMLAVFYFILFRPMRRRQKHLQEMINNLKRGDKIVTNGGIMGIVMGISDKLVQVRIADSVTIDISRNAVASLQQEEGDRSN